ncbi:MAG: hypothetical protein HW387_994 [Parachlamydiales bacterium]|nr:hypothetical protein [Parachlamydiales bacterium]
MQRTISQTPLRISLFGGSTDYPDYYLRRQGATLGMTIDKYIYVGLSPISPFFDHKIRISYSKIELVNSVDEIQHPSIKACLKYKNIDLPMDIHIIADLPAKTGLGSSSAFTVGFLNSLYAMQGIKISQQRLAEEACYIEQNVIQERVGSQDQFHAAFGGFNVFQFDASRMNARSIIISRSKKTILDNQLLMFYTGQTRFANEVLEEQLETTKKLENDTYLTRIYEMVFEAEDIISQSSDGEMLRLLGRLLDEGWNMKKKLSSKISNPVIDQYYDAALSSGAYGGKLCGAGGGGFLIFMVPKDSIEAVRNTLKNLLEVHFFMESQGSTIIYMKD